MNASQAAVRAGYSEKTARQQANRMLTNVYIQKQIQEHRKRQEKDGLLEGDDILKKLKLITEDSMQKVDIMDSYGDLRVRCYHDPKTALRALELLGKHKGLFESRLHIQTDTLPPITVNVCNDSGEISD